MSLELDDLPDRITIIYRPEPADDDVYGNPTLDWTGADRAESVPANVQVADESEDAGDRARRRDALNVWLLPGTVIGALDRAEFQGDEYQVDGNPEIWREDGADHHVKVTLIRSEA